MNIDIGPPWHIESTKERIVTTQAVIISATEGPICYAPLIVAPLIVTAVNSHDALVEALKAALRAFRREDHTEMVAIIRAALAKAQEEPR